MNLIKEIENNLKEDKVLQNIFLLHLDEFQDTIKDMNKFISSVIQSTKTIPTIKYILHKDDNYNEFASIIFECMNPVLLISSPYIVDNLTCRLTLSMYYYRKTNTCYICINI